MNTKAPEKAPEVTGEEKDAANPFEGEVKPVEDIVEAVKEILTPTDGFLIRFLDGKVTVFDEKEEKTIYRAHGNEVSLRTLLGIVSK